MSPPRGLLHFLDFSDLSLFLTTTKNERALFLIPQVTPTNIQDLSLFSFLITGAHHEEDTHSTTRKRITHPVALVRVRLRGRLPESEIQEKKKDPSCRRIRRSSPPGNLATVRCSPENDTRVAWEWCGGCDLVEFCFVKSRSLSHSPGVFV